MIRVVVIEDSPTARDLLVGILEQAPDISVVGAASSGGKGIELVGRVRPDVVTMDVMMPEMDGYEATRRIMSAFPTPIIIVSTAFRNGGSGMTFKAMEAGALTVVEKPSSPWSEEGKRQSDQVIRMVRLMSEVHTVTRRKPGARKGTVAGNRNIEACVDPDASLSRARVIAVGASTGGPPALKEMLGRITPSAIVPIVVVQHIVDEFAPGFVKWLGSSVDLPVEVPRNGQKIRPGCVYVAPPGGHTGITDDFRVRIRGGEPVNGALPSVSSLFRSVADSFGGESAAVLLSGMGKDGAAEMKELRDLGGFTIAQNMETAAVFGMPGEAVRIGGASVTLSPTEAGDIIRKTLCAASEA